MSPTVSLPASKTCIATPVAVREVEAHRELLRALSSGWLRGTGGLISSLM